MLVLVVFYDHDELTKIDRKIWSATGASIGDPFITNHCYIRKLVLDEFTDFIFFDLVVFADRFIREIVHETGEAESTVITIGCKDITLKCCLAASLVYHIDHTF